MAKIAIGKASTDVTVYVNIQSSDGAGVTDLVYNSSGLICYYVRPLGSATQITLATQTVTGAHSDGGFVEVSKTYMPGIYRLDLPDAVCATGVNSVVVMLSGAAGMLAVPLEIQLTTFDLNDATPDVTVSDMAADSITASALKADAVTEIQSGLALEATLTAMKGAGWTDENLTTIDANVDAILADTGTDGVVLKAAGLATDAVTEIVGGVWGSNLNDYTSIDEAGGEILTAIGNVAAIKAKTDNLPADPADESSLEAAIAAVPTLDAAGVRTAVGLASANLDTQLSTINSKTTNLPSDPADASVLAGLIAALPQGSDYTQARAVKLDYLDAAISSRATSGEGTISWTYTLTASDNVTPIAYATVWVTSDAAGTAIEASGQTDAAGQVTFMLNAGTYYVWRKKRGYRFQNPDIEVVV